MLKPHRFDVARLVLTWSMAAIMAASCANYRIVPPDAGSAGGATGVGGGPGAGGSSDVGGRTGTGGSSGSGGGLAGTGGSSPDAGADARDAMSVDTASPTCMAPTPDLCSSQCVSVQSDATNCGRCGHSCLGGQCLLGTCQPVLLGTGRAGRLFVVAVDDSYVYWGGDYADMARAPKNGGPTVPLTTGQYAYHWTIAGGKLYWINDWQGLDIQTCPLPGCTGGPVGAGAGMLLYREQALVSDPVGQNIFWQGQTDGANLGSVQIRTMNLDTKAVRTLVTGRETYSLAADNGFLYFGDANSQTIEKVPVAGGGPVLVASTTALSFSASLFIAVCGTHLYWTALPQGSVYSAPLPNGTGLATVPVFASSGEYIWAITCDDSGVYWATSGSIAMCPHTGCAGPPRILAPGQAGPWSLTTDADAVYWVTPGDAATAGGGVYKVAK